MAQPDICKHSRIYGGVALFDYSVKPGPEFVKVKARFGPVVGWAGLGLVWPFGDQVGQVQVSRVLRWSFLELSWRQISILREFGNYLLSFLLINTGQN